jgi:hypothetical protein
VNIFLQKRIWPVSQLKEKRVQKIILLFMLTMTADVIARPAINILSLKREKGFLPAAVSLWRFWINSLVCLFFNVFYNYDEKNWSV